MAWELNLILIIRLFYIKNPPDRITRGMQKLLQIIIYILCLTLKTTSPFLLTIVYLSYLELRC